LDLVLAQLSNKVKSVSKVRTPHMDTIDTLIVDDKYKMYNTPQKRVCAGEPILEKLLNSVQPTQKPGFKS